MSKRSNRPMIPDSVYPRKRASPLNMNKRNKIDSYFVPINPQSNIPVPMPPKKMIMKHDPPNRVKSPFAPPPAFYDEDVAYNKNISPLPEGVRVSPVIETAYGDIQRVYSPDPSLYNKNASTKSPDVGPIEGNDNWGIYDTDFKGGRRKTRKSRKRRKTKRKTYKKRSRKTRKSRKNK